MEKRVKLLLLSIGIALLVAIISTSYAYFTISNKTGSEETITSGTMALTLHDGSKIETNFMIPGEYIEKSFSVTNTGNLATSYDIYLSEVVNDFADKTDLVYTLTSSDGGYSTPSQVQVPSSSAKIVDNQSIGTTTTHHYTLRITFLNKNEAQDDNQGKHFSGKIQINEYQDVNNTNVNSDYYYTFGNDIKELITEYEPDVNCVSNVQTLGGYSIEDATTFCNGGDVNGFSIDASISNGLGANLVNSHIIVPTKYGYNDWRDLVDNSNNQRNVFIKVKNDFSEIYVCSLYNVGNGEPACIDADALYEYNNVVANPQSDWNLVKERFYNSCNTDGTNYAECYISDYNNDGIEATMTSAANYSQALYEISGGKYERCTVNLQGTIECVER